MTTNREYGRADPAPVKLLPELVFDMSEGRPLPPTLGETETPVNILPELAFDMRPADPAPALQLSLSLRPGATPGEVALDLLRLYVALNQLELSQRGAGLTPDEALCETTATNGNLRITLKPADPNGAVERLAKLASLINGAPSAAAGGRLQYPSIERYEAKVISDAA